MQIFEYPYIIITILVLGFIFLAAMSLYFAIRGIKTANGKEEKDFINISKLESSFEKAGKLRQDRCVIYINVSLENCSRFYSDTKTAKIFSEIKSILLDAFYDGENGAISVQGEKNFVAFVKWNVETVRKISKNALMN